MGGSMSYDRIVHRRHDLVGDYCREIGPEHDFCHSPFQIPAEHRHALYSMIAGDLRRLERDARDPAHLAYFARQTGLTPEQVKLLLDVFFEVDW